MIFVVVDELYHLNISTLIMFTGVGSGGARGACAPPHTLF